MKIAKTMYGLEYRSYDGACTFDIFKTLKSAEEYAEQINKLGFRYAPLFIFKAEFNSKRIYQEERSWNYDDCADTIISDDIKVLKKYNQ